MNFDKVFQHFDRNRDLYLAGMGTITGAVIGLAIAQDYIPKSSDSETYQIALKNSRVILGHVGGLIGLISGIVAPKFDLINLED